jgi:ABC-2 type transport system ATP-binding protein
MASTQADTPTVSGPAAPSPDLRATAVTKRFRVGAGQSVTAVDGLNLVIAGGTVTALAGPNGAGKSTLLRLLAGLLRPDEGSLRVAGLDAATEPDRIRNIIGYVAETPGLYDRLYPAEYLKFFAKLYDLPRDEQTARVEELLRRIDLQDARRRIGTFSKGMKQRLNVARAILHRPRILLLDEPADGLDAAARAWLYRLLSDFARYEGGLAVIASHHLQELDDICDLVVVMRSGRVLLAGSTQEVRRAAVHGPGAAEDLPPTDPGAPPLSLDAACLKILGQP